SGSPALWRQNVLQNRPAHSRPPGRRPRTPAPARRSRSWPRRQSSCFVPSLFIISCSPGRIPVLEADGVALLLAVSRDLAGKGDGPVFAAGAPHPDGQLALADRKSTRLNSSHVSISYAVFCLKKKSDTKFTCSSLVHFDS